ncbi:phosphotransferase [Patescibacteria group bacterium]|nr:phosphotransferase [Patescibacteria group bacterium]
MLTFIESSGIDSLLKTFFPTERLSWKSLDKGLLNQNILVEAQAGRYLLKIYRPEVTSQDLQEIHQVMEFVGARGIPVPKLVNHLETTNGQGVGLYTFLPGKNPSRYSSAVSRVANVGDMLGRIHVSLEEYRETFNKELTAQDPALPTKEEKLEKIEKLIDQAKHDQPPQYEELIRLLTEQAKRLASRNWDVQVFDTLPRHLCHGDFHTKNILCKGNKVTGVLDWEKTGWGGHAYEVMRSIVYNCCRAPGNFNWQSIQAYIRAYRQHQTLTPLECELAFPFVFQKLIFGTWMEEQYLKGRPEVWENVIRRCTMNAYLFKHEKRIAERIQSLLSA